MIGSIGSFVDFSLMRGTTARAAPAAADAPAFRDRRRRRGAQHSTAAVALAPAAMSALIETQERLGQDAPPMEIDRLSSEFDEPVGLPDAGGLTDPPA